MSIPLSPEGFMILLRRGQHNWSEEDSLALINHLNRFEGEPYIDPDVVTDPCDRADLIDIYLINEVGWDVSENFAKWNDFCKRHPDWPVFLEQHCCSCMIRHAEIAAVMAVQMPKAKAILRRKIAQITTVDPARGAEIIEHYGADLVDTEDKGE